MGAWYLNVTVSAREFPALSTQAPVLSAFAVFGPL